MNINKNNAILEKQLMVKTSWATKVPIKLTAICSLIFLLGGIGGAVYSNIETTKNRQTIAYIGDVGQVSERLSKVSPEARAGNEQGFKDLDTTRNTLSDLINVLESGGSYNNETSIPALEKTTEFNNLISQLKTSERLSKAIYDSRSDILSLKRLNTQSAANLRLIEEASTNFNKQLNKRANSPLSQEFYILHNRIKEGMNSLFLSNEYDVEVGYNLVKDLKTFDSLLDGFKNGSMTYGLNAVQSQELKDSLRQLELAFTPFRDLTLQLIPNVEQIEAINVLNKNLIKHTNDVLIAAMELTKEYENKGVVLDFYNYIIYLMFILSLLGAFLLSVHFLEKEKQAAEYVKALSKSQNNQAAIDMLREQLKPIARRDFTRKIYIADDFVTQIAEHIEKIRLSFSDVVRQIKRSAFYISQNADNTDNSSKKLVEVSDLQNKQLQESISQINAVTAKIDEVAQGTWFAERKSLEAAGASKEGGLLVKNSIYKMNDIRKNIQESSKKIKKSSESAQAISAITSMIQNITKKIEVLSINAAILAASSGESGREFGVVATSVQRLALESRESTSEILKLVQEVQQDIAAAVSSMEITTQEVVEGAKLTEMAGVSLNKTEQLSADVAKAVGRTTKDLEEKSEEMAAMSLQMQELQQTTDKAKEIIQVTVKQVESLNKISKELEESVSKYKVEDQEM